MTYKTKGIVLRTIRYGETSIVVTIFTALFGIQTYLVNGIRTAKRSGLKAALYQPGAILDMDVYHNQLKNLQRIKECNWAFLYQAIFSDVIKNSIALYITELLYKTLKQPEQNEDLYDFCEDALLQLDNASRSVTANFALFFSLHLTHFMGFKISNIPVAFSTDEEDIYLDLQEGEFVKHQPQHPYFIQGKNASVTAELLKIMQPTELAELKLNQQVRRELLLKYQEYYSLHIHDFGQMKTLAVLHEVLG